MKKEPLLQVFERLSAYIQKYKVLSEGELKLKIRMYLNSLSAAEREELERNLKGDIEALIFKSITSPEKISVFSPDLRTRLNYQGEVFYCLPTHGYLSEELENAFLRWATIRSPVSALKDVITDFMERCNYKVKEEAKGGENEFVELSAVKKGETDRRILHLFIFPSIKFVPQFMEEHYPKLETPEKGEAKVIVIPTEKTPAPFILFLREHDVGDTVIWVVDVVKKTVNPFIGAPIDADLETNFANPEQARSAVSVWMRKMHYVE